MTGFYRVWQTLMALLMLAVVLNHWGVLPPFAVTLLAGTLAVLAGAVVLRWIVRALIG